MDGVGGSEMSGSQSSGRAIQSGDVCIIITDEELKYRRQLFPDTSSVLKTNVRCTACGTSLVKHLNKGKNVYFHPILQVLVCEDCRVFYGDGDFPFDDDKSDTYCRWCAQGGSLYCCSACNFVFCKPCIRRNFKKSMLEEIEEEDWKCFVCNPESLWKHRAICWAARKHVKENPGASDEPESSNDERKRAQRRAVREKKWRKGKSEVGNTQYPKRSKPAARPSKIIIQEDSSNEDDGTHRASKRLESKKEDRNKKKQTKKLDKSEKNKRKEKKTSEESESDDNDSDDKRFKNRKLKKKDKEHKHVEEKEVERSVSTTPKRYAHVEGDDSLAVGESSNAKDETSVNEEARQISVMQKTCHIMQNITRDTQIITHSTAKKSKQVYLWISEKNKVSHKQLPTTPAKVTKMIESFKKILQKLSVHTEELHNKVLEAEKEWMGTIEGNKEAEAEVGVNGEPYKEEEVSFSDKCSQENIELSTNITDDTGLDGVNTSTLDDASVNNESYKNICSRTDIETNDTIANNVQRILDASMDNSMSDEQAKCKESESTEKGEKTLENGIAGDSPISLETGRIRSDHEAKLDKSGEDLEKENEQSSYFQEEETSAEQKSSSSKTVKSLCSVGKDENGSRAEGDISEDRSERISDEISEKADVELNEEGERTSKTVDESKKDDNLESEGQVKGSLLPQDSEGSKEGERTSETVGKSRKDDNLISEGEVNNSLLPQDLATEDMEDGTNEGEKGNKEVEDEAEDGNQMNTSVQDLFDSDKEDIAVNMDAAITQLNSDLSSKGESEKIGKVFVVDEENSQRTSVNVLEGENVLDEKPTSDSETSNMKETKIKPSIDDRNAKMTFLLDTSMSSCSDSEIPSNDEKVCSGSSSSESGSEIESGDLSKKNEVKNKKKSSKEVCISSILSQQEDARLRAGCFVALERITNHNHKTVNLKTSKKIRKMDSLRRAINRLGNLASLDKCKTKSDSSESEDDSDESCGKKKKKTMKKKSKVKKKEDEDHKDSSDDENSLSDGEIGIDRSPKINVKSEEKIMNALAAELLANSSPNANTSSSESENEPPKKKTENKTKTNVKKEKKDVKKESSDESSSSDINPSKSSWKKDKLLCEKLSATDSSEEERKWRAKKEKEKATKSDTEEDSDSKALKTRKGLRRRLADSDSDVLMLSNSAKSSDSSDFEIMTKKRKRNARSDSSSEKSSGSKVKKKKLRRIKMADSDSDSKKSEGETGKKKDDAEDEEEKEKTGKGRKNIRKVMKGERLAEETKAAAKSEQERLKRIAERQKMYNEIFTDKQNLESLDKVILDFDPDTKKELVSVHPSLVKKLKPHQAEGVKFMWNACFESLKMMEESKGSGCILAHCMGLGKTLQVITLVHTLLTNPETKINTVLVICPLNTVLNWVNEFKIWLKDLGSGDDVEVFELSRYKLNAERMYQLKCWQKDGGVMILGYEMYRNLSSGTGKRVRKKVQDVFRSVLVDPGPDVVICDEGHLLKNIASALSKAVNSIKTERRIVLTGTPLQNNLKEYYCMIQFVKPNLLGTSKEFLNRFVNPITNGQLAESTPHDVRVMKRRAHVLHKMLEGSVQRRDYLVLTPFLPPKYEYVIGIQLTELQSKLYIHYLENVAQKTGGATNLFNDFQNLQRIWTHPRLLKIKADIDEKKKLLESDSEGSLKDFIDDDDITTTSSSDSDDSEPKKKRKGRKGGSSSARSSSESEIVCLSDGVNKDKSKESKDDDEEKAEEEPLCPKEWWENYVVPEDYLKLEHSGKLVLLFDILQKCELIGDKVLVFSQSLSSLDVIEHFLEITDEQTQNMGNQSTTEDLEQSDKPKFIGSWSKGLDYFRIDGSVSVENRSMWCKQFNKEDNLRARLFLISTRAGGMGINLIGANRVILFDASWNPSNDLQSIFRIYRFGQNKPCYVYRFLAQGTMEEKIYNRQVTKLSLALRVVDEHQIERHFNLNDLQELYRYEPNVKTKRATPLLPKDRLLAELIQKYPELIDNYHEHDSLLENKTEEELNEEERKAAWEDFENDKKGIIQENTAMNRYGHIPEVFPGSMFTNEMIGNSTLALREAILKMHPNATEEQVATELSLSANRISQYFTNSSYPQMQQYYNSMTGEMHNNPAMSIYSSHGQRYPHQMPIIPNQYGLQNYYHNPVIPSSMANHSRMMPQAIGSTSQNTQQGIMIVPLQNLQGNTHPRANDTPGSSVPKLKIRNDLMPESVTLIKDNDIIIE